MTDLNAYGQAVMNRYPSMVLFTPSTAHGTTRTFTTLTGLAGAAQHSTAAVSEKGTVVGNSCVAQPSGACSNRPFLWKPTSDNGTAGVTIEIPVPSGFLSMTATTINSNGDVVGTMTDPSGRTVPFLYSDGTIYDLTTISGLLIGAQPTGINDKGQIVLNNNSYVYLASPITPVPVIVPVTLNSQPQGLHFLSEGSTYTTPHTFQWLAGSVHSLSFGATLQPATSQRLGFVKWSDGGTDPFRTLTIGQEPATLVAQYVVQHRLTTAATPNIGGVVSVSPSSPDGYYNEGSNRSGRSIRQFSVRLNGVLG